MSGSPHALLTLQHEDGDLAGSREQIVLLRRNLSLAGIQVSSHRESTENSSADTELRSDPISLCTLGVTFLTSGAAVALINALRATFQATRSAKIHVKVVLPAKTIDISGDQLSDAMSGQLLQMLQQELQ
jgi:hypothetical protein